MSSVAKKNKMSFSSYVRNLHYDSKGKSAENHFGLSPEDFKNLQDSAEKEDRTVPDLVTHAVRVFLNRVIYFRHYT